MKRFRNFLTASMLSMLAGVALAQTPSGSIPGDNNDCNQVGMNTPSSGDLGNCRNNVSGTYTNDNANSQGQAQGQAQGQGQGQAQGQKATGGTGIGLGVGKGGAGGSGVGHGGAGGTGGSAQGGSGGSGGAGGLSQAAINDNTQTTNVVNNRSVMVQTPNATMAAVTSNSGNMVSMTTACGPRVHVSHEKVNGVFFTMMSGQESVDLGKHDVVRPAQDGDVFTTQRIESARTTLLIGHQVSLSCTRVAVAGQRGFGIGGSSSGGSGAVGVQNGGLMETMICKAAISGCVAATLVDPEPKPIAPPKTPVAEPPKPDVKPPVAKPRHPRHQHNPINTCQAKAKKTSMVLDTCGTVQGKAITLI